jgi:hypothetical protein
MHDSPALPDSAACSAAEQVARRFCSPSLFNHSVRSYMWAAALGARDGVAFDQELLYVAALLHDVALTEGFDSHALPFETAGAHVAWVFGTAAGWTSARSARAADAVERHMGDAASAGPVPEARLLQAGTALDIAGARAGDVPDDVVAAALEAWPRLDLAAEFAACFAEQARRKPGSKAAAAAPFVDALLLAHPHETG